MATTPKFNSGKSCQFTDLVPVALFGVPGVLTTTDNALILRVSLPRPARIYQLRGTIVTAPTGQAVILDFKKFTVSTGAIGASIGTVTIAAGTFSGISVLAAAVSLAITEGLLMEVTQIGSGVAGSNAVGFADGVKGS